MKRALLMILTIVLLFSSCKNEEPEYYYNEEYINEILVHMNSNISSLKKMIEVKTDGRKISAVESIETGYIVTFDDNSKITLYGKSKLKKTSTPYIGINNYDGKYLWTVTVNEFTQFVEIDNNKQSVLETDPVVKVDGNGFWVIELEGRSIIINDKNGDSIRATDSEEVFACELKETDQNVGFVFLDGTEIVVSKVVETEQKPDENDPISKVESKGFYVVNEDWFGHDNGTVNYFQKDGDNYIQKYRVFRAANPGQELGTTTCYGAVWGDNMYFVSKQGSRLVVADAATMKSKKVIKDLGGDGRSFVGVDDKKGYIGYMGGIKPLNLSDFSLGNAIDGVSGQIGNMCVSGGKLFAVSQSNLYIININTDKVEKTIGGAYNSVVTAKDGSVWVAASDKFVVYNPETLETNDVAYPSGAGVGNSWGAWNPGGLCASTQTNTLYWTTGGGMFGGGNRVCKYDIDSSTANASFYTIPNDEEGKKRVFYGAGLRVDPLSDNLVIQSCRDGWGDSYAYNWISVVSSEGNLISSFVVGDDTDNKEQGYGYGNGYYWFPTMPVFEDANKPQIILNQIMLSVNNTVEIDLSSKIIDYDNSFASIVKKVELVDAAEIPQAVVSIEKDKLIVKAGNKECNCKLRLTAISNGIRVEKDIELVISSE